MGYPLLTTTPPTLIITITFLLTIIATKSEYFGNETDRSSLLELKANLVDLNGVLNSWNASNHFCQWYGVKCGRRHRRVVVLDLSSENLSGSLSPHIGNLSFLSRLNLSNNRFDTEIPSEIGKLRRLKVLSLYNNSFSGQIPSNISHCRSLIIMDLYSNALKGKIPSDLRTLSKLIYIGFGLNGLTGTIPSWIGNLSSLQTFWVTDNKLEGPLPDSLGNLKNLGFLDLDRNDFTSMIPASIFNLSNLQLISMSQNRLEGSLPSDIGLTLPKLAYFAVCVNKLSGFIPKSLSNATNLIQFEIVNNTLIGDVPPLLQLNSLNIFSIDGNFLGGGHPYDLQFLCTLTNSTNLRVLTFMTNNFSGSMPGCIGNLSVTLSFFRLSENSVGGILPTAIGNLKKLELLDLSDNIIRGEVPTSLGNLTELKLLNLGSNRFSGRIPSSLGNQRRLITLSLADNSLLGPIPSSFGQYDSLSVLDLSGNDLDGSIPAELMSVASLSLFLDLSQNHLTGTLPSEVGKLVNLGALYLDYNNLSGQIPLSIGNCLSMEELYLENNFFEGTIPSTLRFMKGLRVLNISSCNLTGRIPEELQFLDLKNLSLSFNGLEGTLPTKGVFSSIATADVVGNDKLCGGLPQFHLPKCEFENPQKRRLSRKAKLLMCTSSALVAIACLIASAYLLWYKRGRRDHPENPFLDGLLKVSYHILSKATGGFSSANLIGVRSFGSVYKGFLDQIQMTVAIKVLDLARHEASKSFIAKCEALKNTRHRNLVKVITACSGVDHNGNDFKALVYEFMSNGCLDDWLHPKSTSAEVRSHLSLIQRVNIGIDVASALDYLHHGGPTPIIHCDLKPSNVLLDEDMTGHIGDFGLTRFIPEAIQRSLIEQSSSVGVTGSIGYIAPEYGAGSGVSTYGDVHSFGVLLLEMFTGKRPTDDMFREGQNLRSIAEEALESRAVEDIIDPSLFDDMEEIECNVGGSS